jgi:molybdopterin-synthase adenylyltransferase
MSEQMPEHMPGQMPARGLAGDRHHRQMLLSQVGEAGQRRLGQSTAVVVGCGALGTVASEHLVRAGTGRVVIADRDVVELTNLQRQTLFDEADAAGRALKAAAAARRLGAIDAGVSVWPVVVDVAGAVAEALVLGELAPAGRADVVLDCTDNFLTRYLLNDVCVKHGVPLVYAGAVGTVGMGMTIVPGDACLRCVFTEVPEPGAAPTCDTAGVLSMAAGVAASVQACEALKVLLGRAEERRRGVLSFELWGGQQDQWQQWRTIAAAGERDPLCVCCGQRRFEFLDAPLAGETSLCGSDAVQVSPRAAGGGVRGRVDLAELASRLRAHGEFSSSPLMCRGVLRDERVELTVFADGRAIVRGTRESSKARALYARYVGA